MFRQSEVPRHRTPHPVRVGLAVLTAFGLFAPLSPAAAAPAASGVQPIYLDTRYPFAERAADLVARMTLPEKVAQLRTNSAPAIPRLGVQQYTYWNEAQHGVSRLGGNVKRGSVSGGIHATSFPTNLATSMSWDPELIYQETTAISDEIRGLLDKSLWGVGQNNIGPNQANYGNLTFWAPTVNMARDPRWGRNDEDFGEDPTLTAVLSGAYVNGYQGQTRDGQLTTPYLKVAATAKHLALNNVEGTRHTGSSDTTDANIRDYYTPQFRSLVQDAHVSGLMTSYNRVNGTPAGADTYLANLLAQRTWGFGGYSTSDCGAITDIYAADRHNWAPPGWSTSTTAGVTTWTNTTTGQQLPGAAGAQAWALRAGTQLNCKGDEYTETNIMAALRAGVLSEGVIDEALVRVFTVRMSTGEFDPADRVAYTGIGKEQIDSAEHRQLAETVATHSVVLLKNDPVTGTATPLLPADPARLNQVVIVGNLAGTVTLGGYSGEPTVQVSAVQGITAAVQAANPAATVVFDACGTTTTATTPANCAQQTLDAARTADLVVVFVGTDLTVANEGRDRATLALPGNQRSLVDQLTAVGNPRTALAIQAGGPLAVEDVRDRFPAVVFTAYNGQSQGTALANVLFGRYNPSGRLSFTWYRDDSQLPDLENYGLTPGQTGGLGRTYQYFTATPSYPFGYGLSYTDFTYRRVSTDRRVANPDQRITVRVEVTNTGQVPGATVAQVYAVDPAARGNDRPIRRLVGFAKTAMLQPGQTERVSVGVDVRDLAHFDEHTDRQVVTNGRYRFEVGPDSAHAAGVAEVDVVGRGATRVAAVTVQPGRTVLTPGDRFELTATNQWIADDTATADQHVRADRVVEAVNDDESFVDLRHARVTYRSSNPRVATVDRSGRVTAVAAGVATISVTVDGVTGTTPVAVRQPFSLDAPRLVQPGSTVTATTALPNPGTRALTGVRLGLSAPDGWTVRADGPTTFATVAPGTTATTTWTLVAPDRPGTADLFATASFTSANGAGQAEGIQPVSMPFGSVQAAYGNVGVSDDTQPSAGNLDGGGYSLSAQALAAAVPALTPGGTVAHAGLNFTWPDAAPGTPNNVLASGQTIPLSGSGTRLGVIGMSAGAAFSGPATVTYTDGSTTTAPLSFSDWYANSAAAGSQILVSMPYHNTATGQRTRKVSVYVATLALDPGKVVAYLTLPDTCDNVTAGPGMHVFATAVG